MKKKKEKELSSGDSSSEDEYVKGRKEKTMFSDSSDEEDTNRWMVMNVCATFPPITEKQGILCLKSAWQSVCPPVEEKDVMQRWCAAMYYKSSSYKPILFIGKVIRRFLQSEEGPAH